MKLLLPHNLHLPSRENYIYFADILSPRDIAYACNMFSRLVQEDNSIKYKEYLIDIFYYDMNIFYLLNKEHYFFLYVSKYNPNIYDRDYNFTYLFLFLLDISMLLKWSFLLLPFLKFISDLSRGEGYVTFYLNVD